MNKNLDIRDQVMYPAKHLNRRIDYEEGSTESSNEDLVELVRKERETWNKIYESLYASSGMDISTQNGVQAKETTQGQDRI